MVSKLIVNVPTGWPLVPDVKIKTDGLRIKEGIILKLYMPLAEEGMDAWLVFLEFGHSSDIELSLSFEMDVCLEGRDIPKEYAIPLGALMDPNQCGRSVAWILTEGLRQVWFERDPLSGDVDITAQIFQKKLGS